MYLSTSASSSYGMKLRNNVCATNKEYPTELVACRTAYQSLISVYPSVESNSVSNVVFGDALQQISTLVILRNYTPFVHVGHMHLSIFLSTILNQTLIINVRNIIKL